MAYRYQTGYSTEVFSIFLHNPTVTLTSWCTQDRRRIEKEAFSGQLLGIIATNALELGVDIGVLDAVILLGFPYTLANLVSQFYSSTAVLLIFYSSVNKQVGQVEELEMH